LVTLSKTLAIEKKIMINYLNILNVWDVVEKEYIPKYNPGTNILTTESLLVKKYNVVYVILNSISEGVALLLGNMNTENKI
jgi:hypothetical protein